MTTWLLSEMCMDTSLPSASPDMVVAGSRVNMLHEVRESHGCINCREGKAEENVVT